MSSKSKLTVQGTGRWIRVGVFSASALLPLLNTALNRIRARQEAAAAIAHETTAEYYKENVANFTNNAQSEVQERLQTVGATLGDVLTELRTRSNNQDLIKRTNDLRDDLRDRSSKLSHAIVARSGEVSHELAKRSGEVSHEFAKRGRQAQLTIAEQDRRLWIALGFGFGLTATGIVTFILVRHRLQQPTEVDEAPIQLSYDAATTKPETGNATSESRGGLYALRPSNGHVEVHSDNPSHDAIDATTPDTSANQVAEDEHPASAVPSDAAFVGVASTKHYYPVETPLDQLADTSEKPVDIIYFVSETEAQAQGFQAAEV
jgi:hypothetical protein